MAASTSTVRAQLLRTAQSWLEAMNEFTPQSVSTQRSPVCKQQLFPKTLHGHPLNNKEYSDLVGKFGTALSGFRLQFRKGQQPIVDEVNRKVVMFLESQAQTKFGLYQNEYIWILSMTDDGTEIDDIVEFTDSLYASEWGPKLLGGAPEKPKA